MAGRDDYQDRKDEKNERRRAQAFGLRASSEAGVERSVSMLPDNGQPILVGHHSEKRHRRDLERSDNIMRKAVEDGKKAERLEQRADASESSGAISSDDPDALPKLRAKLAGMEAQREKFKQYNKDARKAGKDQLPAYVLTNLGGNIRRVQLRIKELEAAETRKIPEDHVLADSEVRVHWDVDTNRVQVFSPKPSREDREARTKIMRTRGFLWARSEGCWQRLASPHAWHEGLAAAKLIAAQLAPTEQVPKTLEQGFAEGHERTKNNPCAWGHE